MSRTILALLLAAASLLAASRDFPDDIETRLRGAIEAIKTEAVYGVIYDRYFGP